MKRLLSVIAILTLSHTGHGQTKSLDFAVDSVTRHVGIFDSVKVGPDYRLYWAEELITKWGDYTAYGQHTQNLLGYRGQAKKVMLAFEGIHGREGKPGKYYRSSAFYYYKLKSNGKVDSSDPTNGSVGFNLNFNLKGEYLYFEFTDFYFGDPHNELGHFEDPQLLGPDGVHFLSESQKPWSRIKKEYYARFRIIFQNLKEFISSRYKIPDQDIIEHIHH